MKHARNARVPGDILETDYMRPRGLSANRLAMALCVTPQRVNEIVNNKRRIGAEMALRLAAFFDWTTAEDWLKFQVDYELVLADKEFGSLIEQQIRPAGAYPQIETAKRRTSLRRGVRTKEREERTTVGVELGSEPTEEESKRLGELSEAEHQVFGVILKGHKYFDAMFRELNMSVSQLNASLVMLELSDLVVQEFLGTYVRAAGYKRRK